MRMAGVYYDENNLENAYILYAKVIVLSLEKLKLHPDYTTVPVADKKANKKILKIAFDRAEKLKQKIKLKYQEEYQSYLEQQARAVALAREEEANRKFEEEQRKKNEEKARKDLEEKKLEIERKEMDEFLRIQEQKKLELERLAIEAEFGPKTTLTDEDIPLVPLNIANQLPTVPPTQPSVSSLNTNVTPPTPMPRNLNPSIPSRTSKPASLTSQSTVNTTNVVYNEPDIDRNLKPVYDSVPSTAAFGASFTKTNNKYGLRTIFCPANIDQDFRRVAINNTARNIETCGLLFGTIKNDVFVITHVLVPHQTGKPDSCDVTRDEDLIEFSEYCKGVCLGWIHTHPSQTAFLSSVDMHTHYPNQLILPESVAIVCSDKYKETGYFMLTPDHGMKVIGNCRLKGFHPHQNTPPLSEECSHVIVTKEQNAQVVDWRNK